MNKTPNWRVLLTRERSLAIGRIILLGIVIGLYQYAVLPLPVLFCAVGLGLYPLLRTGMITLVKERRVGTEVFVTIATIVAMLGGEYTAGAIMMTIILVAELIAEANTERARASIRDLIGSVPSNALVKREGNELSIGLDQIRNGDIVLVRAGEKIPVDGTVLSGSASVNQAPITGESMPQEKVTGAQVFAGTIVELGALDIITEKVGADTMFSRIVSLVETAESGRAPVQKLADRVAAWLIPLVLVFLLIVWFYTRDVRLIVTLLIFTSPAELGLATPLVVIAAIARAARSGILLKGGIFLEELAKVDVIAFDKTGTLTEGRPKVVAIERADGAFPMAELVRLAAGAERRSSHPLAKALLLYAEEKRIEVPEPSDFEVIRGRGVRAVIEGRTVLAGNVAHLQASKVLMYGERSVDQATTVHVSIDGVLAGSIMFADVIRANAKEAISRLKASGVKQVIMLSGDNQAIAQRIGVQLGVDKAVGGLMPDDKLTYIVNLQARGHRVAMVGDGINDAPALAAAHVGIAMGVSGTEAALEAADVALMNDDVARIATARTLARRAYRTIQENLIVGVGVVHLLGIIASLMHWIGPIQAALIHLGPDILVFLNSVKLLRVKLE